MLLNRPLAHCTLALAFFLHLPVYAENLSFSHKATPAESLRATAHNKLLSARPKAYQNTKPAWQPVPDTANFGYVLMNAEENRTSEVADLRRLIAQNLPADVKLVILTHKDKEAETRTKYLQWIPENQLIVATDTSNFVANGFWARDSFPVPVANSSMGDPRLISARYFRRFESADTIGGSVSGLVDKIDQYFVGGNLLADEAGRCFVVDSERRYEMGETEFRNIYGCNETHLMPYVAGIGDIDEVIKPLPGNRMLLTQPSYKSKLEDLGYSVIMLPNVPNSYRTYANSLIVGKRVFMPVYRIDKDAEATQVYESLGYQVVPIKSNYLSDRLNGSVHCQTMAYPKMDQTKLFRALGIKAL